MKNNNQIIKNIINTKKFQGIFGVPKNSNNFSSTIKK